MGREIIFLHFGQAGVQIGSALWELFCIEHRISSEGGLMLHVPGNELTTAENISALFYEGYKSWTPRAVMIDLEPTVIDEIRAGPYRKLWRPSCLVTGKEDAANNYGRGNCTIGKLKMYEAMEAIRKLAEESSNFAAFETIHSHSGGTGSGMTSLIIDQLCDEYGKKFKFSTSVFPSPMYSQSTVDPYNAILHAHATIETLDCDILIDNQTMFERCTKNLDIYQPSYTDINRLLAQMLSSVFMSHRFIYYGSQHCDTTELLTNLIPYPRIHFPTLFYAPLVSRHQSEQDAMSVLELTRSVFSEDAQTIEFPCKQNAYISCAMLYRGENSPKQIYDALQMVKGTPSIGARFVDWCPTGFKIGLNTFPSASFPHSPLAETPRSVCMLAGNLGMRHAWHRNNMKFDILFSRRSFVHWFIGEGIEESEFVEARDDMAYLEQDYAELMSETIQAVEMVEPPMHSSNQNSVRTNSSIDAENARSRGSTNHESERIRLPTGQSNNANTRIPNDNLYDRHPRKPLVNRYGDTDFIDWELPNDRDRKSNRKINERASNNMQQARQESRFSFHSEPASEWPIAQQESNVEPFPEGTCTDSARSRMGANSNSIREASVSYRQPYRLHGGEYSPYEYKSTDIPSNASEPRTTEVSRPNGPHGFNMNNARHSQASNDTGFYPTEPLVQQTDCPFSSLVGSTTQTPFPPPRNVLQEPLQSSSSSQRTEPCEQVLEERKLEHHRKCRRRGRQRLNKPVIEGLHTSPLSSVASAMSFRDIDPSAGDETGPLTESELLKSTNDDQVSTDASCVVECFESNTGNTLQPGTGSATSGLGSMSYAVSVTDSDIYRQEVEQTIQSNERLTLEEDADIFPSGDGCVGDSLSQQHRLRNLSMVQVHHKHRKHHRHRHHTRKQNFLVHHINQVSKDSIKCLGEQFASRSGCKHSENKQYVMRETNPCQVDDFHDARTSVESTQCWSSPVFNEKPTYEVSVTENDEDRANTPVLSAWSTNNRRITTCNLAPY